MNRREFVTWVGIGGFASSLPLAIAACSPKSTEPESQSKSTATSSGTDGFQSVGTVTELKQKGQILNKEFSAGPLLIVSNPTDPKTLSAVNPTCTHRGCTVEWKAEQKTSGLTQLSHALAYQN
ncbi:MAG TPA: cytochrome B6 [Coleofasciculaceae cyanobacterium]|jgi:cytochrome b6-f complex iron-sulfur subunit